MIARARIRTLHLVLPLALFAACATRGEPSHDPSSASAGGGEARAPVEAARAPAPRPERVGGTGAGSMLLLARVAGRTYAYAADEDDRSIHVVDVETQEEASALDLGATPGQLVMTKEGTLFVAVRGASEVLAVEGAGTDDAPLHVVARAKVPTEPIGLALSPDEKTLAVTSGWGRAATALDLLTDARGRTTLRRRASFEVAREPRAVVFADDGRRVFVSHAVGQTVEVVDLASVPGADSAVHAVAVDGHEEAAGMHGFTGEVGRSACQGYALAKSIAPEGRVFAPHVLAFTGDTTAPSSGYGSGGETQRDPETFDVAVLDEDKAKPIAESLELRSGMTAGEACALPRAAAASRSGSLFVTCVGRGADKVIELDGASASPHDAVVRSWAVAPGPTGIALDEEHGRAFVWSQFAHALTTIATSGSAAVTVASVIVPESHPLDPELARGRVLFHAVDERRISGDGRACASCHPDGRDDTLVWSSPEGPRQTPMLAGRLSGTAPYGWTGEGKDVPGHLAKTFKRLGGRGMAGEDRDALIAWVNAMPPPPGALDGPAAPDASLVARGERVFRSEETGCSTCHGNDGRSPDGDHHDVKSKSTGDTKSAFDTPSLRFVGGSGPYFHDGRYATLHDLLVKSDGKMGNTKQLSKEDLAALEAFLRTR